MTEHSTNRTLELAELLKEVRRIEVQSNRLVTDVISGGYSSVFKGSGIEFDEVREYVEGDDPRSVDWNVTARVGRPYIKKYIEERERTVMFLLDLSASMNGGFGIWSARQMAARICACLALSAVKNNDKVGFIGFTTEVDKYLPPKKGIGHTLRVVRDCLALPGNAAGTKLGPALEFASRVLRRKSILFVVSDFLNNNWEKELALCARRHDVIAVRLLVPELSAEQNGLMRVVDAESGAIRVVDWSNEKLRESYRKKVLKWRGENEEKFRRCKVDCLDVPVPRVADKDAVARPILKFFRMRELRGARA